MLLCISALNKRNDFNTTYICILYIFCKENDWQNESCRVYLQLRRVINMAQAMINFRIDEKIKKEMEKICREMGMSMTTAFTIFATKVTKEKRIPFEITADPFYSESNMKYLEKVIADIESGKAKLVEHDLIEE